MDPNIIATVKRYLLRKMDGFCLETSRVGFIKNNI